MEKMGKKIAAAAAALLLAVNASQIPGFVFDSAQTQFTAYAVEAQSGETIFEDPSEYLISSALSAWKSKSYSLKYSDTVKAGAEFSADIRVDNAENIGTLKIQLHLNWKEALCIVSLTKDDFTDGVAHITANTNAAFTAEVTSMQVKAFSSDSGEASVYVSNVSFKNGVPSDNARLSSLNYQIGTDMAIPVSDFSADKLSYDVTLPYGLADGTAVSLTGTAQDIGAVIGNASCIIENGKGSCTLNVTAESGAQNSYTVAFTVSKDITLDSAELADPVCAYGKPAEVSAAASADGNFEYEYQWYVNSSASTVGGTKIEGATSKAYTPQMSDIGGWIYCVVTAKSPVSGTAVTAPSRVFASDSTLVKTVVRDTDGVIDGTTKALQVTNTIPYAGKFDTAKLSRGGYFRIEYTGGSEAPKLNFNTWNCDYKPADITASRTGGDAENGYWAEYSYEDCIAAWGDENFTYLKALRVKYTADDYADVVIKNISWNGYPISYGELGTQVDCSVSSSATTGRLTWIYTKHVGGSFDTTRLREDGEFYVEYSGDYENAVYLIASSYSDANSTYAKIPATEYGKTAAGYYAKFSVADIVKKFGSNFRYFDQLRLYAGDPVTDADIPVDAGSARIYLFEGTGEYVDYVEDVLTVPWEKYENKEKDGVAIIGASITQNPMVNAKALEGAPFYKPLGDWNAILDRTDCVNYGIGGQTTDQVASRFDEVLRWDFKKIIMQCGTNDLGLEPTDEAVVERIKGNYRIMFEKAKNSGKDIEIYVFSIMASTPENYEGKQNRIVMVDQAVKDLCDEYDFAYYVDTYTPFLYTGEETPEGCTHPGENHVNPDLVLDAIHPNAKGYEIIGNLLKEYINKTNDSDGTLSGLSYRTADDEGKTTVTGFSSGKTDAVVYDTKLPYGTPKNAQVKLYATASDSGATVTSADGELTDGYLLLTLKDGKAAASVTVTSKDGAQSNTYTVNFSVGKYIYENSEVHNVSVDLSDNSSWPYCQYDASYNGTVYAGAKIEYDLTLDGTFTGEIYNEADFNWVNIGSVILKPDDFDSNKVHVTITTDRDYDGISGLQIKFGNTSGCDYKGNIAISNLTVTNGPDPDSGSEDNDSDPESSAESESSSDNSSDTDNNSSENDSSSAADSIASESDGSSVNTADKTDDKTSMPSSNGMSSNPPTGAKGMALGGLTAMAALMTIFRKNHKDK
ncbi:GDSL-type esterase/lipase family protein [Ruminococcus sp. Marseille-P6503]|uniref:GDSL-type esterase/lipase family protein n=1 Tax=Ruminococcus sp. Marseille-P6503 TaxID=2364796 RepID=UPI0013DDA697|nr:GDSL-type esterase/lipase family protein [Ruminococcus sp. Marseille-P6503]